MGQVTGPPSWKYVACLAFSHSDWATQTQPDSMIHCGGSICYEHMTKRETVTLVFQWRERGKCFGLWRNWYRYNALMEIYGLDLSLIIPSVSCFFCLCPFVFYYLCVFLSVYLCKLRVTVKKCGLKTFKFYRCIYHVLYLSGLLCFYMLYIFTVIYAKHSVHKKVTFCL